MLFLFFVTLIFECAKSQFRQTVCFFVLILGCSMNVISKGLLAGFGIVYIAASLIGQSEDTTFKNIKGKSATQIIVVLLTMTGVFCFFVFFLAYCFYVCNQKKKDMFLFCFVLFLLFK